MQILFVCLGNICRSPLAEGVFQKLLEDHNLTESFSCDSAGTSGYHVGQLADSRMRETAKQKGILLTSHSRQVKESDFFEFDYIVAMDRSNFEDLQDIQLENAPAQLLLLREFDNNPGDMDVPDPYYGGERGFMDCYDIVERSIRKLYEFLCKK